MSDPIQAIQDKQNRVIALHNEIVALQEDIKLNSAPLMSEAARQINTVIDKIVSNGTLHKGKEGQNAQELTAYGNVFRLEPRFRISISMHALNLGLFSADLFMGGSTRQEICADVTEDSLLDYMLDLQIPVKAVASVEGLGDFELEVTPSSYNYDGQDTLMDCLNDFTISITAGGAYNGTEKTVPIKTLVIDKLHVKDGFTYRHTYAKEGEEIKESFVKL